MKKFSLLFAGGGTGGHLWPGIALGNAFQDAAPDCKITFLVPGKPVDYKILAETKFCSYINPMRSLPSSPGQLENFFCNFYRGWQATLRVFRKCRPNLVIGLGGYGSLSAGILAQHHHIPLAMLESNFIAGKVVRWLSRRAKRIYTPGMVVGIAPDNIKPLGVPVRRELQNLQFAEKNGQITILVMGGSQGARCLNHAVCQSLPHLIAQRARLNFIHLCGEQPTSIAQHYRDYGFNARVLPFYPRIEELYRQSDLIICRAGGGTISEITTIGLPAVLVPLARAADGHQRVNAVALEKAGAAVMIPEKELTSIKLAHTINALLADRVRLQRMATVAKSLGRPKAAENIACDLLTLLQLPHSLTMVSRKTTE